MIFFFFSVGSEGSDIWVYSTSFIRVWCCSVRKDLIEAMAELVWGHFKNHTEIDLEPMTLCNLAKQRKTMIYWTRSDCPRAAVSRVPLVRQWGSMNSIAGFYINTWIWPINPWDDGISQSTLLTFRQYSCFCVLVGFYQELSVPKDSGKQILVKVSREFSVQWMVWKHFCNLVIF